MAWMDSWLPWVMLGLGLGLGVVLFVLTAPLRQPARSNPWAQRSCRDWESDKYGSALDGAGGRLRWLHRQESDS